jgi:hypothetical protein
MTLSSFSEEATGSGFLFESHCNLGIIITEGEELRYWGYGLLPLSLNPCPFSFPCLARRR